MIGENNISVICCWNNSQQYQTFVDSLKKQTVRVKVIGIDNRKQQFTSCSCALNFALDKVDTKYVIFAHQDILLQQENVIEKYISYLEMINENSILGVAGSTFDPPYMKTNILVKDKNQLEYGGSYRVKEIEKCDTLDECFFGGYTKYFKENLFDEKVCNAWHLYAVELCLRAKCNGGTVYVCDIPMIHYSKGKTDASYNRGFYNLCKAYCKKIDFIRTPCCYACRTNFISRLLYYFRKELGRCLRSRSKEYD